MRSKHLSSSRGVTLVELMIAMTISVTMVMSLSVIVQNTMVNYAANREKSQTRMRSRLSIDFLAQELRNAGYLMNWAPILPVPPLAINSPITGATVDANTESITVRYARAPLATTLPGVANLGITTLTVNPLTFDIPANSYIVLYSPPSTVEILQVTSVRNVGDTTIPLTGGLVVAFSAGDFVAPVVESAFWIEGGHLMMRSNSINQRISSNIEDLQVALIDKNQSVIGDLSSASFSGMTNAQILDVRAVRLSLTGRSDQLLKNSIKLVPPSLEDHDRSGESPDQFSRKVLQTTTYLRNMGVLD